MSTVLTNEQIDSMRNAGAIVRECLDVMAKHIKAGMTTKSLEQEAEKFIFSRNAKPAFKGYKGFPASVCTSRNEVVVHGIPSDREVIQSGDIVSIDVGVAYQGIFADAARTFAIGHISQENSRLMAVTEEALYRGIKMARSGNHVQDISWAIQSFVESNGFNVVRVFVGHGIGIKIHEEPEVPNFGHPHKGRLLEDGMALAIEPMVNAGTSEIEILDDGWTAVTKDSRPSAHFEHTIIIHGENAEIIT